MSFDFNAFQHISTHFNIFQHISTYFNIFQRISTYFNIFKHISTYFNTFQHISTYFNTFQHISTYFNTFQHISTHFNIFQHISKYFNATIMHLLHFGAGLKIPSRCKLGLFQSRTAFCKLTMDKTNSADKSRNLTRRPPSQKIITKSVASLSCRFPLRY